ncbi:hypothetical protein Tco_0112182 [Tanacetum coccineum]
MSYCSYCFSNSHSFGVSDFFFLKMPYSISCSRRCDPTYTGVDPTYQDPEGDILLLEAILNSDDKLPVIMAKDLKDEEMQSFKELRLIVAKVDSNSLTPHHGSVIRCPLFSWARSGPSGGTTMVPFTQKERSLTSGLLGPTIYKDFPDLKDSRACSIHKEFTHPHAHFGNPVSKSNRLTFYLLAHFIKRP